jgi:cytochrome c
MGYQDPPQQKNLGQPRLRDQYAQTTNHAPVVNILQPLNHSIHDWNTMVPYSVQVSDAEDGESKYQEIQSSEVLIKLQYAENGVKADAYLKQKKIKDTVGLNGMLVSNCFDCHGVKSKHAGPSFQDIAGRYPSTEKNIALLSSRIQKGSNGIWGSEKMPSHPELNNKEIEGMVNWILRYTQDPGLNFFTGLEGTLSLNKPRLETKSGFFVVSAYYTDHGTTENRNKKMTGSDQILISAK